MTAVKKYLLFLFLVTSVEALNGQPAGVLTAKLSRKDLDSIRHLLLIEKRGSVRVDLLNTLARGSNLTGNLDSMPFYANQALHLAEKINYISGQTEALNYLTRFLDRIGNYPEALKAALKSLQLATLTKDTLSMFNALRTVSLTYDGMKDYKMVLVYTRRTEKLVHSDYHLFRGKTNQAFHSQAGYLTMMGDAFDGLDQMDSALYYRRLAYQAALYLNADQIIAVTSEALGRNFLKTGEYDSAFFFYRICIPHAQKTKFRYDLAASSQLGLARIFERRNRIDSALYYAKLALKTFQGMKFVAEQLDVASFLNRLYAKLHRFDSAYAYQGIMIALNDSVYSNEKVKAADSIKYNEALREEQVQQDKLRQQIKEANLQKQLQQVQTEKQSLLKNILLISIAIIIVFTVVVLRNIMLKRRNEKTESGKKQAELQHQKAEIEMQALRAQMNPHFIFNSLNSINRFILKKQGAEASEYLTKFSRLIRMILNSSASASVTVAEDLEALKLYLELERLRCDDKFSFKIECKPDIDLDYMQIPPMLLQPFVENAIWHGLMNKESEGHLWINIEQEDSALTCTITDDGIGRKRAAELNGGSVKHKSMGMKITESRIAMMQKMNGQDKSIEVKDLTDADGNAAGTEVVLRIPVVE